MKIPKSLEEHRDELAGPIDDRNCEEYMKAGYNAGVNAVLRSDALTVLVAAITHYNTPGIHERWRAEEALDLWCKFLRGEK